MEESGEPIPQRRSQALETKEADPKAGLSVNGSQLIALANLGYLEEYGFAPPLKPNLLDRLKTMRNRSAHRRLTTLKRFVFEGKTQEAKSLLEKGLVFVYPVHDSENRIKETIGSLSKNVSVEEALKDYFDENVASREFIQSLPGKPLSQLPEKDTRIYLTQLGARAFINPELNQLGLSPVSNLAGTALLPADQQHPLYIDIAEVDGVASKEITISRLELFAELAKRYPKVFTHLAGQIPTVLKSSHLGLTYSSGKKLYVETLTFRDLAEYAKGIDQLKSGNEITIPRDEFSLPREDKSNYPLHELLYINPNSIFSMAIFSDRLSEEHKLQGWIVDGNIDIKDKCLIGIWVTPTYRQHLLRWISTWDAERKQQVFGERNPENVLISSVKDLPALEK